MRTLVSLPFHIALLAAALGLAYLALAALCVRAAGRRLQQGSWHPAALPPITILKPLCGHEPQLYEHLRSFCNQAYPAFQVVFGARDPGDPALGVARRLAAELPHRDIAVVQDERLIGTNYKVSNLANMLAAARHAYLVIADSDISVGPDYLGALAPSLVDSGVGVVTCLYRARPEGPLWSQIGALGINEWLVPAVLVARTLGIQVFSSGATLALRRDVLDLIGGFPALAFELADDYRLAELARRRGLRTKLSPYVVETLVSQPSLEALLAQELRQGRTLRALRPWGYAFYWMTLGVPLSFLPFLLSGFATATLAAPAAALALRWLLHRAVRRTLGVRVSGPAWLVLIRDFFSLGVWVGSFASRRVRWRERCFEVRRDGRLEIAPGS